MKKYFFICLVIMPLLLFGCSHMVMDEPSSSSAQDSKNGLESEILSITEFGITEGYPDGTIRGTSSVTRYELALFIVNFINTSAERLNRTVPRARPEIYTDVPSNHWASEAIGTITAVGVTGGYPDATFRGTRTINRYEAAVWFHNLIIALKNIDTDTKEASPSINFKDVPDNHWATTSVYEITKCGINASYPDGDHTDTFAGTRTLNGYTAVMWIFRLIKYFNN